MAVLLPLNLKYVKWEGWGHSMVYQKAHVIEYSSTNSLEIIALFNVV